MTRMRPNGRWCNADPTMATVVSSRGKVTGTVVSWRGDGQVEVDVDGHTRVIGELLEHWQRRQK